MEITAEKMNWESKKVMKNYKNKRGIWQKEAQHITKLARQKEVKKILEAMWHIMRKYP
jgi:hypothetical protein